MRLAANVAVAQELAIFLDPAQLQLAIRALRLRGGRVVFSLRFEPRLERS